MINKLETSVGEQIKDSRKIEEEILNYFSNLYSSEEDLRPTVIGLNWALLKEQLAVWLETKFEKEEVKKAIDQCCLDKAPGPGGFSLAFFQLTGRLLKMI